MRAFLALSLLASPLGCGAAADPCAAPTTGVTLSSKPLADLGVTSTVLECAGALDGLALDCSGAATAEKFSCDDGFGVAVRTPGATVLVHLRNDGRWTAGARLLGGPDLSGAMSVAGLGADLQPPTGATQAAAFDLVAGAAKLNGSWSTTW